MSQGETRMCKKCGRHFPPTLIFRWDSNHMKRNHQRHGDRVCVTCYNEMQGPPEE